MEEIKILLLEAGKDNTQQHLETKVSHSNVENYQTSLHIDGTAFQKRQERDL